MNRKKDKGTINQAVHFFRFQEKNIFPHVISASSTVRFTQYGSFYFVFQALFSTILVMPLERIAMSLQFDVVQYSQGLTQLFKNRAYTLWSPKITRVNIISQTDKQKVHFTLFISIANSVYAQCSFKCVLRYSAVNVIKIIHRE